MCSVHSGIQASGVDPMRDTVHSPRGSSVGLWEKMM